MKNPFGNRLCWWWVSILVASISSTAFAEPATVLRVVDGDTIAVSLAGIDTRVRVAHIDTPERGGHARCDRERQLAEMATQAAIELLPIGTVVELIRAPGHDKYGRVLAAIRIGAVDYGTEMLRRGLARPYEGRGAKPDWCGALQS